MGLFDSDKERGGKDGEARKRSIERGETGGFCNFMDEIADVIPINPDYQKEYKKAMNKDYGESPRKEEKSASSISNYESSSDNPNYESNYYSSENNNSNKKSLEELAKKEVTNKEKMSGAEILGMGLIVFYGASLFFGILDTLNDKKII